MIRLESGTAIVSGGAVGIDRACVIRVAEKGAKVAILDLLKAEGKALAADLMAKGHEVGFRPANLRTRPVGKPQSTPQPRMHNGRT